MLLGSQKARDLIDSYQSTPSISHKSVKGLQVSYLLQETLRGETFPHNQPRKQCLVSVTLPLDQRQCTILNPEPVRRDAIVIL